MPRTRVPARQVKDGDLTSADFDSNYIDGLVAVASLRTLGTGAQQAAAGNHSHSGFNDICAFDYSTAVESTSSTSFADTSLSVSVTPTSVSDKVLIRAVLHGGGDHAGHFVLTDGSNTILAQGDTNSSRARVHTSVYTSGNSPTLIHVAVMEWVLTPGSTSEQTYKVRWRKNSAAGSTIYLNRSGVTFSDNDAWPVCVSTLFAQVLRA